MWDVLKKPLIVIGVLLCIYVVALKILPAVQDSQTAKSPVVSMNASNEMVYKQGSTIKVSDFKVKVKHKNGRSTSLKSNEFSIDTEKPAKTGSYTAVKLTYKANEKITCTVKVKNQREPVVRFNVGTPNLKDVKAVLYDNGELCFEGTGDVLQFQEFPWLEYDENADYQVKTVTFEDGVTPTSMDEWFHGLTTLTYVDPIPSSVESLSMTFAGTSLKKGVDWSNCTGLRNLYGTYAECSELKSVPAIPSTVRVASYMCQECTSLTNGVDCIKAEALEDMTGMYDGCSNLISVSFAPNVTNISAICQNCINIKAIPEIPASVLYMESSFSGDTLLTTVPGIPAGVLTVSSCFKECKNLTGTLVIDANPDDYSGWLTDAVIATNLDLTGQSQILNELALKAENTNVTVNGAAAVEQPLY